MMGTSGPDDNPRQPNPSPYDLGPAPGGFPPTADPLAKVFDELFPDRSQQTQQSTTVQRGDDLRCDVSLTLEEAVLGTEKTIHFQRLELCNACEGNGAKAGTAVEICSQCRGSGTTYKQRNAIIGTINMAETCSRCQGRGRTIADPCWTCGGEGRVQRVRERNIRIPAGVDTDMKMPLRGEGNAGGRSWPPGDLYVVFTIHPHPVFQRDGKDLYCNIPISTPQAALGTTITVPLIDGKEELKVPEGSQNGHRFTLRGRGVPDVSGRGKGNLYIVLQVEVPRNLTSEQRELFKQLAATLGEKEEHKDKGLFGNLFRR